MKQHFALFPLLFLILAFFSCQKADQKPNTDNTIKGCGDFVVSKIIGEDMVLTISIDRNKIGFSTDLQTFENAVAANFATIEMEQNCDIEAIWYGVCNDVFQQPDCPSVHWTLTKGKLSFKVNKVPTLPQCDDFYLATVMLENAEFQKDNSTETQTFDKIEFKNVQVGWCAG